MKIPNNIVIKNDYTKWKQSTRTMALLCELHASHRFQTYSI